MRLGRLYLNKYGAMGEQGSFSRAMFEGGTRLLDERGRQADAFRREMQRGTADPQQPSLWIESQAPNNPSARMGDQSARNLFVEGVQSLLGPVGPLVRPFLERMGQNLPDTQIAPGRTVDQSYLQEAHNATQALQDLGVDETFRALSSDITRVIGAFNPELGEQAGRWLNQLPEPMRQMAAPMAAGLAEFAPGWMSETANAQNYARIARHMIGNRAPTAEDIQTARQAFDQFFGNDGGIFGENFKNDRAGALALMTLSVETDRGSGGLDPERIANHARAADILTQSSGQTITHAAAANILRYAGPEGLGDDPAAIERMGREIGESIKAGYLTPGQVTEAARAEGLHGVRNVTLASRMAGSSLLDQRSSQQTAHDISRMASGAQNTQLGRALHAVDSLGEDAPRRALRQKQKVVDLYHRAGDDPRLLSQAFEEADKLVRMARTHPDMHLAFTHGHLQGSRNPLEQFSPESYAAILATEGVTEAQNWGARDLRAALSGDQETLDRFVQWMQAGQRGGGIDRSTQALIRQNPQILSLLRMQTDTHHRRSQRAAADERRVETGTGVDVSNLVASQPEQQPKPQTAAAPQVSSAPAQRPKRRPATAGVTPSIPDLPGSTANTGVPNVTT